MLLLLLMHMGVGTCVCVGGGGWWRLFWLTLWPLGGCCRRGPLSPSPYPTASFTVTCSSNSDRAGHYNVTVTAAGSGGQFPAPRLFVAPWDPTGVPAMVTVRPVITSSSSNAGGLLGGFPLTLRGSGFSNVPSDTTVCVQGVGWGCCTTCCVCEGLILVVMRWIRSVRDLPGAWCVIVWLVRFCLTVCRALSHLVT
jgi:hypothetical protein